MVLLDMSGWTSRKGGINDSIILQVFLPDVQELRARFDAEAATTGQPKLLLTAAVAAGKDNIDTAYDIPQLNQ